MKLEDTQFLGFIGKKLKKKRYGQEQDNVKFSQQKVKICTHQNT